MNDFTKKVVPPILVFIGVIGFWEVIVHFWEVPEYLIPAPSKIAEQSVKSFNVWLPHIWVTFLESFFGFALGSIIGWGIAVWFSFSKTVRNAFYPYTIALKSIPVVAIAPLLIVWFGNGIMPKIIISAIISFFPVVVNVVRGLNSVDSEAVDLFRSLSASPKQIFFKLQFYTAIPYLFSALKISATLSVIGAIVGEFSGADKGLGFLILISSYRLETVDMFIGIVFSSLLGIIFFYLVNILESFLAPWAKELNID